MTIARMVARDESLPHQIVIYMSRNATEVSVSCNCRRTGVNGTHVAMGHVPVGDEGVLLARKMFDDPANHNKLEGEPDFHPTLNNYRKIRHVEVSE